MKNKERILICGILPPPVFGHSAMYKILMESTFVDAFDITFLNMKFWSYGQHKKVTLVKLFKLIKYLCQYIFLVLTKRPRYVLYNMSFDKMPFLKDFLFCFLGKTFGCRIVIHDMGQYVKELYGSSGRLYKTMIRWLLKNTTACILLGENTKKVYNGFIDRGRLFCVPGSVEDSADVVVDQKKEQGSAREINVLYFSFMSESKGVLTAIQAASKVLENKNSVRFTFAGPIGSDLVRQTFDELRGRFGSRIDYLGYVEDISERTRIYRNADIFIFPTRRDVFGLVLLHAMAERLPVVASFEGSVPEIVQNGETGLLIDKGDDGQLAQKILQLADDQPLRTRMGEAGRQRYVDVFSPQKYGARMIDVFKRIMDLN